MLNLLQFSELGKSPEWRNWQTRWTQNPVVLSTVWVRPPPPGPTNKNPHCLRDHRHGSLTRDSPKFPSLPQNGSAQIYMEYRSFDSVLSCCLSDRLR